MRRLTLLKPCTGKRPPKVVSVQMRPCVDSFDHEFAVLYDDGEVCVFRITDLVVSSKNKPVFRDDAIDMLNELKAKRMVTMSRAYRKRFGVWTPSLERCLIEAAKELNG